MGNDGEDYSRLARQWNRGHGYSGVFNSETEADKAIVEAMTVDEWRLSIERHFGWKIDSVVRNVADPPDFFVRTNGTEIGVELVQLVEADHKLRADKTETPYAGRLFQDMQWTRERFLQKVTDLIGQKGEKYLRNNVEIDVLLIHTAEPWLWSRDVAAWLDGITFTHPPSIRSVALLMDYEPGRGDDTWPLFLLTGKGAG